MTEVPRSRHRCDGGLADAEGFRARASGQLSDNCERRDIDDVDHVLVAARHIECGVIGTEMHVTRTARYLEIVDDGVGFAVDDDEVTGPFGAYENQLLG
jgi:hypothetical protein